MSSSGDCVSNLLENPKIFHLLQNKKVVAFLSDEENIKFLEKKFEKNVDEEEDMEALASQLSNVGVESCLELSAPDTTNLAKKIKLKDDRPMFIESFQCKCSSNCSQSISNSERRKFFETYHSLKSFEERCLLVTSTVSTQLVKRRRQNLNEQRCYARKYHINGKLVCKVFYLKTLNINKCRIDLAFQKLASGELYDKRGIGTPANKLDFIQIQKVHEFI